MIKNSFRSRKIYWDLTRSIKISQILQRSHTIYWHLTWDIWYLPFGFLILACDIWHGTFEMWYVNVTLKYDICHLIFDKIWHWWHLENWHLTLLTIDIDDIGDIWTFNIWHLKFDIWYCTVHIVNCVNCELHNSHSHLITTLY